MYYYHLLGIASAILTPYQFINYPNGYFTADQGLSADVVGVEGFDDGSATSSSASTSTSSFDPNNTSPAEVSSDNDSSPITISVTSLVRLTVARNQTTNLNLTGLTSTVYFTSFSEVSSNLTMTYDLHRSHTLVHNYSINASASHTTDPPTSTNISTNITSQLYTDGGTTLYLTPTPARGIPFGIGTATVTETVQANFGTYLGPCVVLISLILLC